MKVPAGLSGFLYAILLSALLPGFLVAGDVDRAQGKYPDSLNKLDSLATHHRFSNTPLAKHYAWQAFKYASAVNVRGGISRSYVILGLTYLQIARDSSLLFFKKALDIANRERDDRQKATTYYCIAALYGNAKDYRNAVILLDSSLMYAEKSHAYIVIADIYNWLGTIRSDLNDLSQARELFNRSLQVAIAHNLPRQCGLALVNISSLEENDKISIEKLNMAIRYFRGGNGCDEELANTLINLANYQENPDSALRFLKQSLDISVGGQMPLSQIGAYNIMAYSYMEKGEMARAESCLRDKAIPIALDLKNLDWLAVLYDSYADLLLEKKDYKKAALFAKKSSNYRVEADKEQSSQQVRLLASLLDLKTKELAIKVGEEALRQERSKVQVFRLWLFITLLLLLITLAVTFWIRQRSVMRLQQEQLSSARKIIELDEQEKSIVARDLHDLTGQMQLAILGFLDNMQREEKPDPVYMREQIAGVGASMRRLSHRLNSRMVEQSGIGDLIHDLCEDTEKLTRLKIHLDFDEIAPLADPNATVHLYRIIQEMITNASKYVQSGVVNLHLLIEENRVLVSYSDSGPGFDRAAKYGGTGLMNIVERSKLLKGEAILNSSPGMGTNWEISFPNK
jgi:two-component system, NarL family, sensor kinase